MLCVRAVHIPQQRHRVSVKFGVVNQPEGRGGHVYRVACSVVLGCPAKAKKAQQDYKVLVEYMEQNNLTAEDVLGAIKG